MLIKRKVVFLFIYYYFFKYLYISFSTDSVSVTALGLMAGLQGTARHESGMFVRGLALDVEAPG